MNNQIFDIDKFNIIQDEENYYLFRAFNNADNRDIENGTIIGDNGFTRIRTDRERWEENEENPAPKYPQDAEISLEQVYDHIKMHYRKDTNCISLSSNTNVSIVYGRGNYADRYAMIKVPKKEMGEKVVNAGQYMLQEVSKKVNNAITQLDSSLDKEILDKLSQIDNIETVQDINNIMKELYSKLREEENRVYRGKKVNFVSMIPVTTRISNHNSLDEAQTLEKNKLVAKLTVLELSKKMQPIIPHTRRNTMLIRTIGNAFASSEQVHYGDIPGEQVTEVPKEIMDIFALLQQQDKNNPVVEKIKRELLTYVNDGYDIEKNEGRAIFTNGTRTIDLKSIEESFLYKDYKLTNDMTIESMYETTKGRVSYEQATSLVEKLFYLSQSRIRAKEFSEILNAITQNNPEYREVIKSISNSGFEIEPAIITRQSRKGYNLSEAVNLDIDKDEIDLVEYIKSLDTNELENILENGGKSDINEMISRHFSDAEKLETIDKNTYYANAIIDSYNWTKLGIEFTPEEREEIAKRLETRDCVELYTRLKEQGVEEKDIPTIALNIATREKFSAILEEGKLQENLEQLKQDLSIEQVEKYLGYFDIPNTGITLKEYQQRAVDKIDTLFEEKRFASVVLPTGAGKSYVALDQLLKHKDEPMVYFAPSNEILEQIKDKIVKYVHGREGTLGKSTDEIVKEVFPQLSFETYQSLLFKSPEELKESQYQFMVLDELHRTGANEWEKKLNTLLEAQDENARVLGITATPQRDRGGKDMAYETALKLGYTQEELDGQKHIAMKMDLIDAIRAGIVVNPLLVSCEYNITQDGTLERLLEKIQTIEDENERKEFENKYNNLRKKLENAKGIPELLESSITKKDGKYIVFIAVSDNGNDLEDDDGNKIGKKKAETKIEEAQKQIAEWLKNVDSEPEFYSMLGEYGNKKNAKQLHNFENSDSEHIKVMVVMNKLNEGIHVDGIDGIIWQRALDEESKILLLQQLGRCIYAIDENSSKDRPIVVDLPNNMLKIDLHKDINTYTPKDDLTLLNEIVDWVHMHNEKIPDINSTNREEARKASTLKRMQEKYSIYLEEFGDDLKQEEIDQIKHIISKGEEIDLWNEVFPEKENKEQDVDLNIDTFELTGILKEVYEFEQELDEKTGRSLLKNALEIEEWCKENYGDKKIYERRLPSSIATDEYENKLGTRLVYIRARIKQYEGNELEKIENEEDRRIVEIIRNLDKEYGLGAALKAALEIEEWCKENYGDKKIYERRLPSSIATDEYENKLGTRLVYIRARIKQYEGNELEKIENEEDRRTVEIIRNLDKEYGLGASLKNALEIEEWCKENYGNKKIYERRLPSSTAKDEYENQLGNNLSSIRKKIKRYEGKELEEIENEEDRTIVEIIRNLDKEYRLGDLLKNALKIEEWCKENYGDKKIYERRLPSPSGKDEYENQLGNRLSALRNRIIKEYEGKELEEIENEEDRRVVEIIRNLDKEYGLGDSLKNALKIEEWCKENYGDKKIYERRLPSSTAKDEYEHKLGIRLSNLRVKIKQYEFNKIEEIENEEDRRVVEIIRNLDKEYGLGDLLKNALEIEEWCKENYSDKKIYERRLPFSTAKDEYENKLGKRLTTLRTRTRIKQYESKELEEIENEEDRRVVEIIRNLDKEYGLGESLKNALEVEEWCKENYGDKKIYEKKLPSKHSKDEYENKLGTRLSTLRKRIKQYESKELEEIENEEDRTIVEIIRNLDKEYGLGESLKNALEIEEWCKENYGDKKIYERRLPFSTAKDEYENKLGNRLSSLRARIIKEYEGKELKEIENEEDRRTVKIIRNLDKEYGLGESLKNALEIEEWCKENYGDKKIYERKLPSKCSKDQYENKLGNRLSSLRKRIKQYEGKELEEIENEEDRRIVEIIRRLDSEYNYKLIKAQDIGRATFDASTKECDEAQEILNRDILMQKNKDIGETD